MRTTVELRATLKVTGSETECRLIADVDEAAAVIGRLVRYEKYGAGKHDHEVHGCEQCDRWEMAAAYLKEARG